MNTYSPVRCDLDRLEQLYRSGEYVVAEELAVNLRLAIAELRDPMCLISYYWLHAEILLNLGHYKSAMIKCKTGLRLSGSVYDLEIYGNLKLTHGRILFRLGRLVDAVESFTESYVFHKRSLSHTSMFAALNNLARTHYTSGNLLRCKEVLQLSLGYAKKYGSPAQQGGNLRNLCTVLIKCGDLKAASAVLADSSALIDRLELRAATILVRDRDLL